MTTPLTVMFWPESAYGPTNQCIGVAAKLRERGHTIVFAAESSWAGKIERFGFIEELVDLAEPDPSADADDAGQFWTDFIATTCPEFAKPTIEQIETFILPTYRALIDGAKYCEPRLREIIAKHRPDVIVEDNVVIFPALTTADRPFVRIVSCSPLEVPGPDVPPPFSGLPSADRTQWDAYRTEFDRVLRPLWKEFDAWVRAQGGKPLPDLEFMPRDAAANLYVYPTEADYTDSRPLDASWTRLDSSVRETDEEYELPATVADRPAGSALIFLSLGSLGSADVSLMQRLIDVLARTPHRFIVSLGPQAARIALAENMVGAQMLPQTKIIPLVDAVISHGGNNTTTEALHFGKPLIVLPLFWDQYENAQRIDELALGIRLDTYHFGDDELITALERVLGDAEMRERVAGIGEAVRARDGLGVAADVIERVGLRHRAERNARAVNADLTPTDLLDLGDGCGLAVVTHDGGAAAVPVLSDGGRWRRAGAGDGVAEALIRLLTASPGRSEHGRFGVTSWAGRRAARGERPITVDQTNESVIVGDVAVVKWATHLEPGPHPAPQRLSSLTAAGFTAMPAPWGLVTWQPVDGAETLVATVTGYLPGAVDGWTWAVDLFAAATRAGDPSPVVAACATVGTAVADLHAAQAATATTSTAEDARRWRDGAMETLKAAKALARNSTAALLADRGTEVLQLLCSLGELVGVPILDAHGDLHVGQVLRSGDRFVITDFDGNPVLPPWQRVLPVPAALDVAGMLQSLSHVAVVVARHHDVEPDTLRQVDAAARAAFLDAYTTALTASGLRQLFSAEAVPAFRLQQVLREIVYAGRHLPRWMYVPDAALPALLEGVTP